MSFARLAVVLAVTVVALFVVCNFLSGTPSSGAP